MADTAIFDLTPETVLTAAHEFVTQDTSAATPSQAATFALMGGLEIDTAYNSAAAHASFTAVVGKRYLCNLSALTGNFVATLPATAAVGERVAFTITTGSTVDGEELAIQANTGDTLNGVAAATDWSRLFITNEIVVIECEVANTTWRVIYDGRIPSKFVYEDANGQTFTTSVYETLECENSVVDVGDMYDSTNFRWTARRAATHNIAMFIRIPGIDDNEDLIAKLRSTPGGTPADYRFLQTAESPGADRSIYLNCSIRIIVADGDEFDIQVRQAEGGNQTTSTTSYIRTLVSCIEEL